MPQWMKNWELGFNGCIMDGRLHGGWHIDKNVAMHEMMTDGWNIWKGKSHNGWKVMEYKSTYFFLIFLKRVMNKKLPKKLRNELKVLKKF
jgi:hypothetical protein